MEKDRFNYLINHYNSLTSQETAELRQEQNVFRYCQVLHQLVARGDQDNESTAKQHSLSIAAVYSTDRAVLKQIMMEPRAPRVETQIVESSPITASKAEVAAPIAQSKKEEPKVVYTPPVSEPGFDVDAALSRFMAELPSMHEKKLQFEKAIEEFEKHVNQSPTPVAKPRGRKPKAAPTVATANTSEQLLEEIKTTKKKVAPASPKQKEQSEIIDQFIKTKPTISKPGAAQTELDLTELTDAYNENVVSETLALILIKQGKKEKAIEVLKKLIWKFPQKKAYFAAQIEDLTK